MKIELTIYPSGGGTKGYFITYEKNTINAMLRGIGATKDSIVLTDVKYEKSKNISLAQEDSISSLLEKVNLDIKHSKEAFIFDAWIYVVNVNGKEMARFNSLTIMEKSTNDQLEILKEIVRQLIALAPIDLDLQSFS